MNNSAHHIKSSSRYRRGFTLVELLVVISIIAVLSSLMLVVIKGVKLKTQKTVCTNLFRNISLAMEEYELDYNRPPLPDVKRDWDTILGDPGGLYSTSALVSVLTGGEEGEWSENDGNFYDLESLNPNGQLYLELSKEFASKDGGLGPDGKLYDPWGQEIMIAINSRIQYAEANNGYRDQILHTWGLAEWAESKPGHQSYVLWSYGKDKVKGAGSDSNFRRSDDVKSF